MWSRAYGGAGDDLAFSVIEASDGGYVVVGSTTSWGAGGRDAWLAKTDANGVMEWSRIYGGTGNDAAYSVVATSDGGYAVAGAWDYSSAWEFNYYTGGDFWLIKTDALGEMEWNRKYGGTGDDYAYSLVTTSDGGYAIAGTWNYSSYYGFSYTGDFWLVKTGASGILEWNRTYVSGSAESLVATSDGGYAIVGQTLPLGGSLLVKTDTLGNMQWNKTYGVPETVFIASSLVEALDGGYALAGYTILPGFTYGSCWLAKTDSLGNMQWNNTYMGVGGDLPCLLSTTSDMGYAIVTSKINIGAGGVDFSLVKTDASGNMQWNQTYGGTGTEAANSLLATSDGGYVIAGWTDSFGAGGDDFWLVKTDELGVVPEYSSLLIPALVLTATAFIIINKKRLLHKRS